MRNTCHELEIWQGPCNSKYNHKLRIRREKIIKKITEFAISHWLLRIPLVIVFIQQGLAKFPANIDDAQVYELPYLVWWFVVQGELGSGLGLLVGGLFLFFNEKFFWLGDLITRFSGFTIGSIMTGVIWIGQPDSLTDVLLYDNFHVILWFGGLYFAMRGNRI